MATVAAVMHGKDPHIVKTSLRNPDKKGVKKELEKSKGQDFPDIEVPTLSRVMMEDKRGKLVATNDDGIIDLNKPLTEQEVAYQKKLKKRAKKAKTQGIVKQFYQIKGVLRDSEQSESYVKKILIGTATTGNIRMEWSLARYGQIIPTNWSQVQMIQYLSGYVPINYLVDDAQNIIVKEAVEKGYEWVFFLEHDVILPPDAFVRLNEYTRAATVPVVSGLYYTKSIPSEPMIYRGRGGSFFTEWEFGERVWADGVPTGCLLIHTSILKKMWEDAPEYQVNGVTTRRVFRTPRDVWFDPETGSYNTLTGTSDLDWCTRVIDEGYFEKAGWPEYQKARYPFLVDTNLFCRQIDDNGQQYP
jgi:hypothetical protein